MVLHHHDLWLWNHLSLIRIYDSNLWWSLHHHPIRLINRLKLVRHRNLLLYIIDWSIKILNWECTARMNTHVGNNSLITLHHIGGLLDTCI